MGQGPEISLLCWGLTLLPAVLLQDYDKHWESQEQGWDVSMEGGNMGAGAHTG